MASPLALLVRQALVQAKALAAAAAQFSREVAFELKTEASEARRTGFGVPRAVTSAASFACFAVAAAGTASITLDLAKKVYGKRSCSGCNGWEALTCRNCGGLGHTPPTVASLSAESATCASCGGTGVVDCSVCHGDAWKPGFTLDRVLDTPTVAWDAYSMCQPVAPPAYQHAVVELVRQTVASLPVPPRPSNWLASSDVAAATAARATAELGLPLDDGDAAAAQLPEGVRKQAHVVREAVLDAAWAQEWRAAQVNELLMQLPRDPPAVQKRKRSQAAKAQQQGALAAAKPAAAAAT